MPAERFKSNPVFWLGLGAALASLPGAILHGVQVYSTLKQQFLISRQNRLIKEMTKKKLQDELGLSEKEAEQYADRAKEIYEVYAGPNTPVDPALMYGIAANLASTGGAISTELIRLLASLGQSHSQKLLQVGRADWFVPLKHGLGLMAAGSMGAEESEED